MKEQTTGTKKGYTFELVKAKNGELTLKIVISSKKHILRHSSYNPSREAEKWVNTFQIPLEGDIILMGLGLGYELTALLSRVHEYQRVYVIEKSRDIFSLFRKINKNNDILTSNRITFIINTPPEKLITAFQNIPSSSFHMLRHPSTETIFSDYYSEIERMLQTSKKETMTAIVLVGRGIVAPFIIQDIALAFRELGCNVELLPLRRQGEDLLRRAQTIKPDFIIALDGTGLDFPWVQRLSCLKIAWFVDNPFYFLNYIDKNTILFCWDEDYIPDLHHAGFKNIFFLPLATNPYIFNPRPLIGRDRLVFQVTDQQEGVTYYTRNIWFDGDNFRFQDVYGRDIALPKTDNLQVDLISMYDYYKTP